MFLLEEGNNSLFLKISSEHIMVDRTVDYVSTYLSEIDEDILFGIRIVCRELITNAIEHGNKLDPSKEVKVSLEKVDKRLKITIEDQGDGFDHKIIDWKLKSDSTERKRGLAMANNYADSLDFSNSGSIVVVWLDIADKSLFTFDKNKNKLRVCPNTSISASNADAFRQELADHSLEEIEGVILDLQNVNEIDSMGLSVLLSFGHSTHQNYPEYPLIIVNASNDLQLLLKFTHADRYFDFEDDSIGGTL